MSLVWLKNWSSNEQSSVEIFGCPRCHAEYKIIRRQTAPVVRRREGRAGHLLAVTAMAIDHAHWFGRDLVANLFACAPTSSGEPEARVTDPHYR
jgi:hypothetical protein